MNHTVFIGFDPREADGFAVTRHSLLRHASVPVEVRGLVLSDLHEQGLYYRETQVRNGRLWDVISEAPCATQFSISRFLAPILAKTGWAIFMDSDMLVRSDIAELFKQLDQSKAAMCVKHNYQPPEGIKMDGQIQTAYSRKNWTSMIAWNCDHPSNATLTVELVNTLPGRDLHALCWLKDEEIGELDQAWNYLVGHSDPEIEVDICHFTSGLPSMAGYEDCEYAEEWRAELALWAR